MFNRNITYMFNAAQGPAALNSFLILVLSTRVLSKRKKYKKTNKIFEKWRKKFSFKGNSKSKLKYQ